jgi:hypothetical protein
MGMAASLPAKPFLISAKLPFHFETGIEGFRVRFSAHFGAQKFSKYKKAP